MSKGENCMLEQEIIKLLKKISAQLDGVAKTQESIRKEIRLLHEELADFEEYTLKSLEARLDQIPLSNLLN